MSEREMDAAIQISIENGRCHITIQAWVKTEDAADRLIRALEILKPLLAPAVDRLRAELASRQIDVDTFREGNQKLRAELATARQENEEFRSEYGELEVKLENCEAELAVSHGDFAHLQLKAQANSAAKDARIEEQNAIIHGMQDGALVRDQMGIIERANARIAELEAWGDGLRESLGTTISTMEEERTRAERAEAERDAMREALLGLSSAASVLLDEAMSFSVSGVYFSEKCMGHKGPDLVATAIDKASAVLNRAALAPPPAGPDGRNLAVLYCMERAEEDVKLLREALEGMIAVAEGRFDGNPHADIDALAKARAALDPSPAAKDVCNE